MIQIDDVLFDYGRDGFRLDIPSLQIDSGEKVAIIGRSGSGKSTLLQLISGVLLPSQGSIQIDRTTVNHLSDAQRRKFRISNVGFVFQEFELIDYLTIGDNIRLPYLIHPAMLWTTEVEKQQQLLVEACGLKQYLSRYPNQLSQGERQRVAVCRSLLAKPRLILADEPTGSLDTQTGKEVLSLLLQQVSELRSTLLMVTHDLGFASHLDRAIHMADFHQTTAHSGGQ